MATNTAVIVLCEEAILIWAIPPLSPQPPDFFDHIDHIPTHIPLPLFTIPFPDIVPHSELIGWKTISSWYFVSSQPLYFDMLCRNSELHRFQIMLKPDLSTASLRVINSYYVTPDDFNYVSFESYRICEDTLVSCFASDGGDRQCGVYTRLTSAPFANVISHGGPAAKMLFPDIGHEYRLLSCPASGRFVRLDTNNSVTVLDFF